MRDSKLTELFGGEKIKPEYAAGSQQRLDRVLKLHQALFWKTKETAEYRIECLNKREEIKNNYTIVIKCLTREEFINIYWNLS